MGVENVYFLLLIFESYLCWEVEYVEGFLFELVVVMYGGGKLFEELVVVCFMLEMIINVFFIKWIDFYCDLLLLVNNWSNIVCWELWLWLFLCMIEFFW